MCAYVPSKCEMQCYTSLPLYIHLIVPTYISPQRTSNQWGGIRAQALTISRENLSRLACPQLKKLTPVRRNAWKRRSACPSAINPTATCTFEALTDDDLLITIVIFKSRLRCLHRTRFCGCVYIRIIIIHRYFMCGLDAKQREEYTHEFTTCTITGTSTLLPIWSVVNPNPASVTPLPIRMTRGLGAWMRRPVTTTKLSW